jgi:peptidoglycan pentaglycine glycine transferase (the first glycine)
MSEQVVTFSSERDRNRWDNFVINSHCGHLMQSSKWGDYKAALGWKVLRIGIECNGQIVAGAQVLLRPLPLLPMMIAYIPKGPIIDPQNQDTVVKLLSAIHRRVRSRRAIFLRIEPNLLDDSCIHTFLMNHGFQRSFKTNQPRCTLVISLSDGEDAVMSSMRKKTRKLIRRAVHEDVEVISGTSEDIDDFYNTLRFAAKAKGFSIHNRAFYGQAWRVFRETNSVQLLLAKYQGETAAAKMVFVFKDRSMHLWGGTSFIGRNTHASYLLQWEAIRWAIARGCKQCDLWGIPDEIGDMLVKGQDIPKDKVDRLWGVYVFKRGFGGEIESYVGAYDYVYSPFVYSVGTKILMRNAVTVDTASSWLERFSRR